MSYTPAELLRRHARKLMTIPQTRPTLPRLCVTTLEDRVVPAVTGLVYQDFNANGQFDASGLALNSGAGTYRTAVDQGVGGLTVTAYDASGNSVGSTTVGANGRYTLNTPAGGPYRVEFTNLPAGLFYGPQGTTADTAVQFLTTGDATNVNLALVRPQDYSTDNPLIFTSQYQYGGTTPGAATSPNANNPTIVAFPYSAGAIDPGSTDPQYRSPADKPVTVAASEVGATWGLGYDRLQNRVFASSYTKRHAGYGPNGPGAIYTINLPTQPAGGVPTPNAVAEADPWFVLPADQVGGGAGSLNALRAGYTDIENYNTDGGNVGWDAVGKSSFGGLDVNEQGTQVYVMNLADRRLYVIQVNANGSAGAVQSFQVPRPSNATGPGALGDVRPFAVQYYHGLVYVGMVNSAESTQNTADLRAYVYSFNPATGTWSDSSVVNGTGANEGVSLNYDKKESYAGSDSFVPWSSTYRRVDNPEYKTANNGVKYPQPMLTGLTFDGSGNLTLGLRIRSADQTGLQSFSDPNDPTYPVEGIASGDLLKAFANTPGNPLAGWQIESNASSTVAGNPGTGQGAGNGQGPGGGEFYAQDGYVGVRPDGTDDTAHRDVVLGGVLQIPGFPDVISTAFDPVRQGAIRTAGVRWFDSTSGFHDKSYILYLSDTPAPGQPGNTFGKAAGLGDLIAVTAPPPIEIGNYVWSDTNANGRQDPGEQPLANVAVQLVDNAGAVIATAVTNGNGNYYFSNSSGTSTANAIYGILGLKGGTQYRIIIPLNQAATNRLVPTTRDADASANGDQRDSDATLINNSAVISLTTGVMGESNHSYDIGLVRRPGVTLGNFVWNDANNNGVLDGAEQGIDGVLVELFAADGVTRLGNTVTSNGGQYYFRDLDAGTFIVQVTPPTGFLSSTGTIGSATGAFEPGIGTNVNNADHGTQQANGTIRVQVAVTVNAAGDAGNPDNDGGTNNSNLRQDFGLFRPLSIGNVVWFDVNNDGFRQPGEAPLAGVNLTLRSATTGAALATTTTNADGGYLFSYLPEGLYRVEVVGSSVPAGLASSTGARGSATGPFEPAPAGLNDNFDHGSTNGSVFASQGISLLYGAAPQNEAVTPGGIANPARDEDSDLTQDFGFFRPLAIGNLVFNDINNDGVQNAGEPGIAGVALDLLDAGGAVIARATTDAAGNYRFSNLTAGTYQVRITPPAGFSSSTGVNGSRTGPFEPAPANNTDSTDHGNVTGSLIAAAPVTLGDAGNPDDGGSANLRQDFGLYRPLSVGDFVWQDTNNNGVLDAGEPPLVGVTVELRNTAGQPIASTTTNANGNYLFTDLAPGQYTIRVTGPTGFISSTGTNGSLVAGPFEPGISNTTNNADHGTTAGPNGEFAQSTVTLDGFGAASNPDSGGTANLRQDFGFFRPLAIGNFVWEDVNNNGVLDVGEQALAGVTVQLRDGSGTLLANATTDANGNYLFTGLAAGSYQVTILPPAGYRTSTGQNGSRTGPFEPGVANNTDNVDHGTDAGGTIGAAVVALSASGNPDNGGYANLRQDFGLFRPLSVGNLVFRDTNNNAIRDAGEAGIANVTVRLRDGTGTIVATATTNANGNYLFTDLAPGNYQVDIVGPRGLFSSSGTGTAPGASLTGPFEPAPVTDGRDDVDRGTGLGGQVFQAASFSLLSPGANPDDGGLANLRQDFGLIDQPQPPLPPPPLSVGNLVFRDVNNDGIRNTGEPGIPGVTVRLRDVGGVVLATATTDANGNYLFTNLTAGQYQVDIVGPPGLFSSSGTGTVPGASLAGAFEPASPTDTRDDVDHGTGLGGQVFQAAAFTLLPAGQNPDGNGLANLRQDFGLIEQLPPVIPPQPPATVPAAVSGYVYRDLFNRNGVREVTNGETGIPGTRVTITGTGTDGTVVNRSTFTNRDGFYSFLNLPAGSYTIRETQPNGFIDGLDTVGSLGGAKPSNDVLTVTLRPNDAGTDYNFGEVLAASIFGFVYEDVNRNRVLDSGEPAIPGVAITVSGTAFDGGPMSRPLTAADSPVGLTVLTDSNGRWEFPTLPPGLYTFAETQPANYQDFFEANQEATPKAVAVGNDIFASTVLGNDEHRGPLNFGEVRQLPDTREPSKQEFLGSSTLTGSNQDLPPAPGIGLNVVDLPQTPNFGVNSGDVTKSSLVVAASGVGRAPLVRVFDYATSTEKFRFYAYEASFTGGVRTAVGDFNGDGVDDILTGIGPGGGPRLRVFSGVDGAEMANFFAYEPDFRGGLFVAAGDVNGDGRADAIVGSEVGGGPRVTVFDVLTGTVIQNFFAFDGSQRGGVRVAAADFNGDGRADIVTTTGIGVPTRVRVFDAASQRVLADYAPYNADFTGGSYIAAGDFNGDGTPDVVLGADAGGGPRVVVFSGLSATPAVSFFAYEPTFGGGVRVSLQDVDGDGKQDIITAPGTGGTGRVRVLQGGSLTELDSFFAFDSTYTGGVYVG